MNNKYFVCRYLFVLYMFFMNIFYIISILRVIFDINYSIIKFVLENILWFFEIYLFVLLGRFFCFIRVYCVNDLKLNNVGVF